MSKRLVGLDLARALAVIGMIIVNFKMVLGNEGPAWLKSFAGVFNGKASATFVVLAGLGIALMSKSAIQNKDADQLKSVRLRIAKRALFLFVIGISYISIWPADILHFYGLYMVITLLLLTRSMRSILLTASGLIFLFPLLLLFIDYEAGWNFQTLEYKGFWTPSGFMRNLFFNGFHPVIPWAAFMLSGYWLGKQDLHSTKLLKRIFFSSSFLFLSIQLLSQSAISLLTKDNPAQTSQFIIFLNTQPMPPLPLYMFSGISIAFSIITACLLLAQYWANKIFIMALEKTGQLALSFYVAHVVIGMGLIELLAPSKMGSYPLSFSLTYALLFSCLCIAFAVIWRKYKATGPLEWVMRKLTD